MAAGSLLGSEDAFPGAEAVAIAAALVASSMPDGELGFVAASGAVIRVAIWADVVAKSPPGLPVELSACPNDVSPNPVPAWEAIDCSMEVVIDACIAGSLVPEPAIAGSPIPEPAIAGSPIPEFIMAGSDMPESIDAAFDEPAPPDESVVVGVSLDPPQPAITIPQQINPAKVTRWMNSAMQKTTRPSRYLFVIESAPVSEVSL